MGRDVEVVKLTGAQCISLICSREARLNLCAKQQKQGPAGDVPSDTAPLLANR